MCINIYLKYRRLTQPQKTQHDRRSHNTTAEATTQPQKPQHDHNSHNMATTQLQ